MNKTTTQAYTATDDAGKLILRVTLAVLILFHGIAKLTGGVDFITGLVAKAGLPAALGYLVYVGEVVAPILVLLGIWTRIGALLIAGNMAVAVLLVHLGDLVQRNETGGWAVELQAMYLGAALAVALLGAGRFRVGGRAGRWN